jgi:hypothetical protein
MPHANAAPNNSLTDFIVNQSLNLTPRWYY